MAKALIAEAESYPHRETADLVVGVADLELANMHQPEVVVAWVKRGVNEAISRKFPSMVAAERAKERVRNRCSFHLLVPMVEAYFFGERAAFTRVGIPEAATIHRRGEDVEDFETDDPEFLPVCVERNATKASVGCPWWREERHPKHYVELLVEREGQIYTDTVGANALTLRRRLQWATVIALGWTSTRGTTEAGEDTRR
jgi:hypothetical protein